MFRADGELTAERQPGVLLGTASSLPMPVSVPPLPLQPGRRYTFALSIDGRSNPEWELTFNVAGGAG